MDLIMRSLIKVLVFAFPLLIVTSSLEIKTGPVSVTRTELKVSRSLNPEDTQTLNVMTRDGNVAQLIVKRRDPKINQLPSNTLDVDKQASSFGGSSQYTRALYTNWIPVSTVYWRAKNETTQLERLVNAARLNKTTDTLVRRHNIIDSDRIPHILPKAVNIRSEGIYVKSQVDPKRGRSMIQVGSDGIPVVHGIRVADDESDEKTWRNARVINGELHPYEAGYKPPAVVPIGELIYAQKDKTETESPKGVGPFNKEDNYPSKDTGNKSLGPFSVKDNIDGYQGSTQTDSKPSVFSGFGPFTKEDNSMLTSKLYEQIRQVNNKEAKRGGQLGTRRYRNVAYFDQQPETPQMQRRMFQYPGSPSYPSSLLYTPTTKLSPVTFTEGVRSPVLQYAHPELGVQPAKASTEEDEFKVNSNNYYPPENTVSYSTDHDMGRQSQSYGNSVEYYKKDVLNYPYGGYYLKPKPEQPFWIKITDSIRDNVHSGLVRMQQLTRPVFEPLVEASQKISYNLGLTHNQYQTKAQDKVGFITTPVGTSVILPALGLVAGGAALGLGAAAVGRFLDPIGMRAAPDDVQYPNGIVFVVEEDAKELKNPNQAEHRRMRRSSGEENEFVFVMEDDYNVEGLNRIKRTNSDDGYMQQVALSIDKDNDLQHLTAPNLWSDTPCSKRLFCDVMVKQNEDDVIFMEKKMEVLLAIVPQEVRESVSQHLDEVMVAVKQKDCSTFFCRQNFDKTSTFIYT